MSGNAGDLATVGYSDGTPGISYTPDRRGRQTTVSRGGMTTTRTLDDAGNLLSESYAGGPLDGLTVTNRFDEFLRRTNLALLNAQGVTLASTAFRFGPDSRLRTVAAGTICAAYSYVENSPLVSQIGFTNNGAWRMTTSKQFDYLNRLTSVSSVPSAASVVTFSYAYNSANQRTNVALGDGTAWRYGYDLLGQVTSGNRRWPDGSPVAGQQFGYTFDDIGNRKTTAVGGDASGQNLRAANYTNNLLNQIASRDMPGFVPVLGTASSNATVTLWADNGAWAKTSRHGEYFSAELPVNNATGAVWLTITNLAVLNSATNDIASTVAGGVLVVRTPETFSYDADGNLTQDGRWNYYWDAENRLVAMTNTAAVPASKKLALTFAYDWQGRRIEKAVYTWNPSTLNYEPAARTVFVHDGWNLIAELDAMNGSTLLRSYVWGLDLSGTLQGAGGVGGLLAVTVHTGPNAGNYFPCFDGKPCHTR